MLWLIEQVDKVSFTELSPVIPLLSPWRRNKLLCLRCEPMAVQSALAELLLRYALRKEFGITQLPEIKTGEKGKPFFPDHPEIHFNLSHCKTAVACAVDVHPIGIDVQEVRPLHRFANVQPDAKCLPLAGEISLPETETDGAARGQASASVPPVYRVLSDKERAWVEAGESPKEQDRRFAAVWTCKEAYGKAIGDGFLYELTSTKFLPVSDTWRQYGFSFRHWALKDSFLTLCGENVLELKKTNPLELLKELGGKDVPMKHFLVVVDMQKDFIDGALGTAEAVAIKPAAVEKIRSFPGEILATLDTHDRDYLSTAEGKQLPVEHCIKGTPGWKLDPQIATALENHGYTCVEKPTFGSLLLPQLLGDLAGEEDFDVELIGLCTDICVISNALLLKANFHEKKISVDASCCAGVTPELHEAALKTMASCQIRIINW